MSRVCFLRPSLTYGLVATIALYASTASTQPKPVSAERVNELAQVYAELRRQDPQLEERSTVQIAADAEALFRKQLERTPDSSVVTARSSKGSVAASARCKEGYVVKGEHSVDDPSVRIVSEELRDCVARRCRAYEVTAASESAEPFDLKVSVNCSP